MSMYVELIDSFLYLFQFSIKGFTMLGKFRLGRNILYDILPPIILT